VLGDWDNPYLTFLPELEAAELRLFADIVETRIRLSGEKTCLLEYPVQKRIGGSANSGGIR
jgi:isoleucyl-tRNA synthetase